MVRKTVHIKDIENKGFVNADVVVLDPKQKEIMDKIEFDIEHKYKLKENEKLKKENKQAWAFAKLFGAAGAVLFGNEALKKINKGSGMVETLKTLGCGKETVAVVIAAMIIAAGVMILTKQGGMDKIAKKLDCSRQQAETIMFTGIVSVVAGTISGVIGATKGGAVGGFWGGIAGGVGAGVVGGGFAGWATYKLLQDSRTRYNKAGKPWSINDVVADFADDLGLQDAGFGLDWIRPDPVRVSREGGSESWMEKEFGKKKKKEILVEGFANELQIDTVEDFNKVQEIVNIEGYFEEQQYKDVQFSNIQEADRFYQEKPKPKKESSFEGYADFSSQFGNVSHDSIKEVNLTLENNIFY